MTLENNRQPFIMIYNILITEGVDMQLTYNELYLYSLLYKDRNISNEVKSTLSLITDFSPIEFSSRKDRNIKEAKESLLGLNAKGVILLSNQNGELIENLKANDSIVVSFLKSEDRGFTPIPFEKFESFTCMKDYYIYLAVARWDKKGGFRCDYDRWTRILQCSRQSAIKYVNNAIDNQIIYSNIGDYKDSELDNRKQKIQELNVYKTTPFEKTQKTHMTLKKDNKTANKKFREEMNAFTITPKEEELENGIKIFSTYTDQENNNIYPDRYDYLFYMKMEYELGFRKPTKLESKYIKAATKRIANLKGNSMFLDEWSEAEGMYYQDDNDVLEIDVSEVSEVFTPRKTEVEDVGSMF